MTRIAAVLFLASLMVLAGCSGALAPTTITQSQPICYSRGDECLRQGRDLFRQYRQAKVQVIKERSENYRLPSAPVAFFHPRRTEYSVLLVHGLNDSSFYMAELAELLYQHGFNVVTVLLPGHGTDPLDMLDVTAEQWRAEVETGLEMASLVGEEVMIGGFSLGGALLLDAILRGADVHALLLFSPALKLRKFDSFSNLTCASGLRSITVETDIPLNPVKYKYRVGNSVCQLSRVMQHNISPNSHGDGEAVTVQEKLRATAASLQIPTFAAFSYADARVDPSAILDFLGHIDAPVTVATFGVPGKPIFMEKLANGGNIVHVSDDNLPHSYLVRRTNSYNHQENPHFNAVAKLMIDFFDKHLHRQCH